MDFFFLVLKNLDYIAALISAYWWVVHVVVAQLQTITVFQYSNWKQDTEAGVSLMNAGAKEKSSR